MEQSQIQRCVAWCQSGVHIFAHRYVNVGDGGDDGNDDDAEECGNLAGVIAIESAAEREVDNAAIKGDDKGDDDARERRNAPS